MARGKPRAYTYKYPTLPFNLTKGFKSMKCRVEKGTELEHASRDKRMHYQDHHWSMLTYTAVVIEETSVATIG